MNNNPFMSSFDYDGHGDEDDDAKTTSEIDLTMSNVEKFGLQEMYIPISPIVSPLLLLNPLYQLKNQLICHPMPALSLCHLVPVLFLNL